MAPCQRCERDTRRQWAGVPLCEWCWADAFPSWEVGRPSIIRPDHGPDQFDLTCVACGATWVGRAWERCGWCSDRREAQIEGQRTLLLCEPDTAEDVAVEAWAARLAIGVHAGLVTAHEADLAVQGFMAKAQSWQAA